ncbi:acetate kinase [Streptomyces antimycoticus]
MVSVAGGSFPTAAELFAIEGKLTASAPRKAETALGLFERHVDTAALTVAVPRYSGGWTPSPSPPVCRENSAAVREAALRDITAFGIEVDGVRNALRSATARLISTESSRVAVAVVPTDEELEIAGQTFALVSA